MKRIVTRQLIILSLITSVSNFSFVHGQTPSVPPTAAEIAAAKAESAKIAYCKSSSICGTAPKNFTLMLDFTREMMNSIKTIGTDGPYLGQYVNPNRFNGNVFAPPSQTLLTRLERNVAQKIKFGFASIAIFTTPANLAGLKDFGGGIILLVKNKVFLRDNKIVEDLDSQVTDKRYELGVGGGWGAKIIPQNLAVMQKIVDAYVEKGLLQKGSKITEGVTYSDITALLVQILTYAKNILYFDTTKKLIAVDILSNNILITFNPVAINAIITEYDCAKLPLLVCSSESKKFKDNFTQISASLTGGISSAMTTVKDAVDRLGQIFSKQVDQSDEFKAREADLLTSMYGTTKVSKSNGITGLLFDPLTKSLASVKKSGAEVVAQVTGGAADIGAFRSFPKSIKGVAESATPDELSGVGSTVFDADVFSKIIDSYVNDVFVSQQTDLKLAAFTEVKDITPAFKILGDQIAAIKDKILGGDEGLVKSLSKAAKLQCGG